MSRMSRDASGDRVCGDVGGGRFLAADRLKAPATASLRLSDEAHKSVAQPKTNWR